MHTENSRVGIMDWKASWDKNFNPEDEGSTFNQTVDKQPQHYIGQQSRRQQSKSNNVDDLETSFKSTSVNSFFMNPGLQ
jgi:hypothetical protein